MSACDALIDQASLGAAPALRAVDCLAGETTATAFARLFGQGGALLPALTIVLTLYIAVFALALLTGRSRLGIAALTPRALTLGLVLTFATSWVAYQSVVWNLAVGAPDQLAGVLMGASGQGQSATTLFADRIDIVFNAIAEAASAGQPSPVDGAQAAAAAAPAAAAQGSFTPGNLMWLSALLLLLGTVGVLVTARIALAVLLAVGPVFVVLALFSGTRGLAAGWLRGVVLTALAPLFVVVGGGIMLQLVVPVVRVLAGPDGIDGRASLALFLIAAVHLALMVMVMKVAGTMVAGWRVFGLAAPRDRAAPATVAASAGEAPAGLAAGASASAAASGRRIALVATTAPASLAAAADPAPRAQPGRTVVTAPIAPVAGLPPLRPTRARGIGSRFAAPQARSLERYR